MSADGFNPKGSVKKHHLALSGGILNGDLHHRARVLVAFSHLQRRQNTLKGTKGGGCGERDTYRQVLSLIQIDGEDGGGRRIVRLTGQVLVLLDHLAEEEHDNRLVLCQRLRSDAERQLGRSGTHLAQSFGGGERGEPLQPQVNAARRDILQIEPLPTRKNSKLGVKFGRKNGKYLGKYFPLQHNVL